MYMLHYSVDTCWYLVPGTGIAQALSRRIWNLIETKYLSIVLLEAERLRQLTQSYCCPSHKPIAVYQVGTFSLALMLLHSSINMVLLALCTSTRPTLYHMLLYTRNILAIRTSTCLRPSPLVTQRVRCCRRFRGLRTAGRPSCRCLDVGETQELNRRHSCRSCLPLWGERAAPELQFSGVFVMVNMGS